MGELSKGFTKLFLFIAVTFTVTFTVQAGHAKNLCQSLFAKSNESSESITTKPKQLKIGTYNLLNLYLHKGNIRKPASDPHEKPTWAIQQMGELLKEQNYDIFIAQEVESLGSAQQFNKEYLNSAYNVYSTMTKDRRGLYVIFFVKKNLPYTFKIESHMNEKWFDPLRNREAPLFERDLPTLHIYRNANDAVPMLTMIGAHFKSKRDRFGSADPETGIEPIEKESEVLRTAQANRATQIIQRYQIKFGYDHPILIAGDFNSNHNYAPEFVGFLRHAKLSDTVGLKEPVGKYSDRTTHSFFGEKVKHNQLDGILITPSLVQYLVESYVVRYKNEDGSERDIPRTKSDRKRNPSDHRPITAIFSVED